VTGKAQRVSPELRGQPYPYEISSKRLNSPVMVADDVLSHYDATQPVSL
jgi:hypothetical protein